MGEIESLIQGSEKLTSVFDGWPSFHDAEVVDLHIWRGEVKGGDWDDSNVFPVLTITVRILEATQPDATGEPDRDVLATFRFHDVDDLILQGFNHQNAILGITVSPLARTREICDWRRASAVFDREIRACVWHSHFVSMFSR
jgi:hypothetical protein